MRRWRAYLIGAAALGLLLAGGALAYSTYRHRHLRNFRVVEAGVLYRSGQLSRAGLEQILRDYQIRTVITFRDAENPGDPPPDRDEEAFCRARGIHYVRIRPRVWSMPDGSVPAEVGVRQFLDTMDAARQRGEPVLVHCFAGAHRTGIHCAIYRMEYQGWTNAEAIAELKACGYANLDGEDDVRGYLERYRPRRGQ